MVTEARRVVKDYAVAYPQALCVRAGSRVSILREETQPEWIGWLWCLSDDGQEGWISKDYLSIEGAYGVMNRDYDAREVSVSVSETVEVLRSEHGWSWVRKTDGAEGWVPSQNLAES